MVESGTAVALDEMMAADPTFKKDNLCPAMMSLGALDGRQYLTWNSLKPFGNRARLLPSMTRLVEQGLGVELWLDWTAEPLLLERDH